MYGKNTWPNLPFYFGDRAFYIPLFTKYVKDQLFIIMSSVGIEMPVVELPNLKKNLNT
jgi:hypothetical protein